MKKSIVKIALILSIICSAAFGQSQKPRFVVSVSGELNVDLADVLADEISYAIIKTGRYDLLANDRQFKAALKKEWQSGNVDDDKIIALAQKAGADFICFAKIKTLLGSNQITAQLVNLKTMLYGSMGKANGALNELDQLTKISQAVVADMLGTAVSAGIGGNSNASTDSRDSRQYKTFTDSRDGKQYKIVTIGRQTWMAENMNYDATGSLCYGSNEINCQKFGKLYDWAAAKTSCPSGWHLPSEGEWRTLVSFVGGSSIAGKKLKGTKGWSSHEGKSSNGADDYGFSALPGGSSLSSLDKYHYAGNGGYWWSASENNKSNAYAMKMLYYFDPILLSHSKNLSFSVRCVRD